MQAQHHCCCGMHTYIKTRTCMHKHARTHERTTYIHVEYFLNIKVYEVLN